ncbi:GNAT family N-acetyltransferase [Pedobacter aquatilis]|uniref:GNAT family N-acetyltransferase n=1 Tax=Pedobacter aquatilis TaxID=351343 RepID=UPI00292F08A8|nr:GNAT family N-acetyltransferase [Pedobacter aquatilis]
MNLSYIAKHFSALNITELYELLKLRSDVFVVEQECVYADLDNKDQESFHILYYADGELSACTRLLPKGLSYDEVSIGRVATSAKQRGTGLGRKLMEVSIAACYENFGHSPIRISAQHYLLEFYQSLGFVAQGDVYDEDGIPHIEMLKSS